MVGYHSGCFSMMGKAIYSFGRRGAGGVTSNTLELNRSGPSWKDLWVQDRCWQCWWVCQSIVLTLISISCSSYSCWLFLSPPYRHYSLPLLFAGGLNCRSKTLWLVFATHIQHNLVTYQIICQYIKVESWHANNLLKLWDSLTQWNW